MVKMIRSGVIDKSLTKLKCGPICHSRWLTTANRIMILYVSKHGLKGQVLKNLALITEFIVTQYYFMWFEIKCRPAFINGPRHILRMVQLLENYAPRRVKEIVVPVINRGAYHAHSENILLSLLVSNDKEE